jgi:amidase
MPAPSKTVSAFTDDALGLDDATALAERLRRRQVSVREVTEAAIARAERVDPNLHAIVARNHKQALATATRLDQRPPPADAPFFLGVPTYIKDNLDLAGLPTRHGSAAVPPHPARDSSPFVRQMLAQGFLCLGKSSLPEFGFNATTEPAHAPPTRNPWHLDYSTGASSGGSAALVAAGVVPVAHANDGGGSIRIPAACCGLVGLKASRGRLVDNEANAALPIAIIADGIVSRTVRDTAQFLAQAERSYRNPALPPVGTVLGPPRRTLRIGLVIDSINGHRTDDVTRAAVERTARQLERLGHRLEPMAVPVPSSFPEDFALYWAMLAFGVRARGRTLLAPDFDKHRVDGLTLGLDRRFRANFWRLPAALWRLRHSRVTYARAMAGFDAVLTPVLGHVTPPLGYLAPTLPFDTLFERLTRYVGFTPLANATGAPAIALPAGLTDDRLPVAIQFMAPHGGDRTLLELAYALEADDPWPSLWATGGETGHRSPGRAEPAHGDGG